MDDGHRQTDVLFWPAHEKNRTLKPIILLRFHNILAVSYSRVLEGVDARILWFMWWRKPENLMKIPDFGWPTTTLSHTNVVNRAYIAAVTADNGHTPILFTHSLFIHSLNFIYFDSYFCSIVQCNAEQMYKTQDKIFNINSAMQCSMPKIEKLRSNRLYTVSACWHITFKPISYDLSLGWNTSKHLVKQIRMLLKFLFKHGWPGKLKLSPTWKSVTISEKNHTGTFCKYLNRGLKMNPEKH